LRNRELFQPAATCFGGEKKSLFFSSPAFILLLIEMGVFEC
jgi:hypothetical protein